MLFITQKNCALVRKLQLVKIGPINESVHCNECLHYKYWLIPLKFFFLFSSKKFLRIVIAMHLQWVPMESNIYWIIVLEFELRNLGHFL